jgi:hypothetical protein
MSTNGLHAVASLEPLDKQVERQVSRGKLLLSHKNFPPFFSSSAVAYPLDVVRRQMQTYGFTEGHGTDHKSTFGAIKTIIRSEGLQGLFRGVSINYIKVIPAVSISFATYEYVKEFLSKTS